MPHTSSVMKWLRLATHPATVRRALITAAIVGSILIAINHGPAILRGDVTRWRIAQMCLTVTVPYLVSTTSSVSTRKELAAKKTRGSPHLKRTPDRVSSESDLNF